MDHVSFAVKSLLIFYEVNVRITFLLLVLFQDEHLLNTFFFASNMIRQTFEEHLFVHLNHHASTIKTTETYKTKHLSILLKP